MGSLKLGKYFRVNASRSGVSMSGGVNGLRMSVGSKGIRTHVTVPGTGYTKTNTLLSFKKLWKKNKKAKANKKGKPSIKDAVVESEEITSEVMLPLEDELVLIMIRRRPFGSFTDKAKSGREVNKAIDAYDRKDYGKAVEYLDAANKLNEDDIEVILYLSVIYYMNLENYEQAAHYFELLPKDLLNEDLLLAYADCLCEMEDYDGSIDVLESFKFDDDEDMERTTLLARNHLEKRNYELAEEIFKSTVGRKRKMTDYLIDAKYWMGVMYLRVGDYENAKKHLMPVYLEDSDYEDIGLKIEEVAMNGKETD